MTMNLDESRDEKAAEPRWLRSDELSAWMSMARVLTLLLPALERQLERETDLNWMEYHVLARLSEQEGHTMRMSGLAGLASASLSRLSHVVKRLEGQGLVRRETDPCDGRYTNAALTSEGYGKLVASAPAHVESVRRLVLDPLEPGELQTLGAVFDRIFAAVDEVDPCR
ncbi:MarR family winged helix-turn-helix transcriptional regulator [Streptomyces sp. MI02-7b]|uniref:MarR family winged helix-turn-helix transcriptional regulator n=1 Tax=Streptomyces sp. MI02-7b TaxID=462941 RepID=UPI0029AE6AFD|nr:MarR family transcriptional regulator [Streptomyces sp. MI02-7b]MDX3077823.1 MarR family transcriptional regulator [Streptomyces sp. MI02-7b]